MSVVKSRSVAETARSVHTRADLVNFIHELRVDLRENPDEWENLTLDDYLESMAAWIEDCDGYYMHINEPVPKTPSWKMLADILIAAKMYE